MTVADMLRPDAALQPGAVDARLVAEAIAQGVGPLLYRTLADRGALTLADAGSRERLRRAAREAAIVEEVRARDLAETVRAFDARGIRPLLFKGAAVAATHYPEPWLRTRGDSDLLVRPDEAAVAGHVLEARGFARVPRPRGGLVTQQARYQGARAGVPLAYDVHWRVADPHAFGGALPYADLERDAACDHPSGARRISNVHGLVTACVHRAAHHGDTENTLLVWDIHLLATAMREEEWQALARFALEKGVAAVCRRGLALASTLFGTVVPLPVLHALATSRDEPTARFVSGPMRKIDLLAADLRALASWGDRAQLVWQHVFPGRDYLASLPDRSALRRAVRGAGRWFRAN
jgi:hypothetical protein